MFLCSYSFFVDFADVPVLRSCQELYLEGYLYNGIYEIDPDGENGVDDFYVYCDMENGKCLEIAF